MGILVNRKDLCACGNNLFYNAVVTQQDNNLICICECNICNRVYIIKNKAFNFKEFTHEQFIGFLKELDIEV